MRIRDTVYPSSQIDSTLPDWIAHPDSVVSGIERTLVKNNILTRTSLPNENYRNFVNFMTRAAESEERIGFSNDILQNLLEYRDFLSYKQNVVEYSILTQSGANGGTLVNNILDGLDESAPIPDNSDLLDIFEDEFGLKSTEEDKITLMDGIGFPLTNGVVLITGETEEDDEIILYRKREGNDLIGLLRGASATIILPSFRRPGKYIQTEPKNHADGAKVVNVSALFLSSILDSIHKTFTHSIDSQNVSVEINRSTFLSKVKDFFRAKGSKLGIKALFKIVFAENDVEVFYPGDRMMTTSKSTWSESLIIRSVPVPELFCNPRENYVLPDRINGSKLVQRSYSGTVTDVVLNDETLQDQIVKPTDLLAKSVVEYSTSYQNGAQTQYELYLNKDDVKGKFVTNPFTILTNDVRKPDGTDADDFSPGVHTIVVESTLGFPDKGLIFINGEAIYYQGKTANEFLDCVRGYIGVDDFHTSGSYVFGPYYIEGRTVDENGVEYVSRSWPVGLVNDVEIREPGLLHEMGDIVEINGPGVCPINDPLFCVLKDDNKVYRTFIENEDDVLIKQRDFGPTMAYVEDRTTSINGIFLDDNFSYISTSGNPYYTIGTFLRGDSTPQLTLKKDIGGNVYIEGNLNATGSISSDVVGLTEPTGSNFYDLSFAVDVLILGDVKVAGNVNVLQSPNKFIQYTDVILDTDGSLVVTGSLYVKGLINTDYVTTEVPNKDTTGQIPVQDRIALNMVVTNQIHIIPRRLTIKENIISEIIINSLPSREYTFSDKGTDVIGIATDGVRYFSNNSDEIISQGRIASFKVIDKGFGYKNPTVVVYDDFTGTEKVNDGVAVVDPIEGLILKVDATPADPLSSNYLGVPPARISSGEDAVLTPELDRYGRIISVTIDNPGKYYNDQPSIKPLDSTGVGKGALIGVEVINGEIVAVNISNTGIDYQQGTVLQVVPVGDGAVIEPVVEFYRFNRYAEVIFSDSWKYDIGNGFLYPDPFSSVTNRTQYGYVCNPIELRKQTNDDSTNHSPILGYAVDGNPIYGPYGYVNNTDDSEGLERQISGYKLRPNRTAIIPGGEGGLVGSNPPSAGKYPLGSFIQDYTYDPFALYPPDINDPVDTLLQTDEELVNLIKTDDTDEIIAIDASPVEIDFILPNFVLDENNGKICNTPEFPVELYPDGVYCYFITVAVNDATPVFPYIIGKTFNNRPMSQVIDLKTKEKIEILPRENLVYSSSLLQESEVIKFDFDLVDRFRVPYLNSTKEDIDLKIQSLSSGSLSDIIVQSVTSDKSKVGDFLFINNEGSGGTGAEAKVSYVEGVDIDSGRGEIIQDIIVSHRQILDLFGSVDNNGDLLVLSFIPGSLIEFSGASETSIAKIIDWDSGSRQLEVAVRTERLIQVGDSFYDKKSTLTYVTDIDVVDEPKDSNILWSSNDNIFLVGDKLLIENGDFRDLDNNGVIEFYEDEQTICDAIINPKSFKVIRGFYTGRPTFEIEDGTQITNLSRYFYTIRTKETHSVKVGDTIYINSSEFEEVNGQHIVAQVSGDRTEFSIFTKELYGVEGNIPPQLKLKKDILGNVYIEGDLNVTGDVSSDVVGLTEPTGSDLCRFGPGSDVLISGDVKVAGDINVSQTLNNFIPYTDVILAAGGSLVITGSLYVKGSITTDYVITQTPDSIPLNYEVNDDAVEGRISRIQLTSGGIDYNRLPKVDGVLNKYIDRSVISLTNEGGVITDANIVYTGRRYTNPKVLVFDKTFNGHGAEVTVTQSRGVIDSVTIVNGGDNYIEPYCVVVDDIGKFLPITNDIGKLKAFDIINPGRNLSIDRSVRPEVIVDSKIVVKYTKRSLREFAIGETLYCGIRKNKTAIGVVKDYDTETQTLTLVSFKENTKVYDNKLLGRFEVGKIIINDTGSEAEVLLNGQGSSKIIIDALAKPKGKFLDDTSKLANGEAFPYSVIQDSERYQWFSYVISSPLQETNYKTFVENIIHPSGFVRYSEVRLNSSVNSSSYVNNLDVSFESIVYDPCDSFVLITSQGSVPILSTDLDGSTKVILVHEEMCDSDSIPIEPPQKVSIGNILKISGPDTGILSLLKLPDYRAVISITPR